jgi:hypothetical protein
MGGILMRHPDLEQQIEVSASAVPHHERSGWKVVEGQAEQGEQWPEDLQRFQGQQQVRMRHPDLPGQQITIAASAVPMHQERGWHVVEDANAQSPPRGEPEGGVEDQPDGSAPPEPPARQRASSSRRSAGSGGSGGSRSSKQARKEGE